MNWNDLYWQFWPNDPRAVAFIMSRAWAEVANCPDSTVAQTLCMNTNNPAGVLNTLQWRNIPVPQDLIEQLLRRAA